MSNRCEERLQPAVGVAFVVNRGGRLDKLPDQLSYEKEGKEEATHVGRPSTAIFRARS